MFGVDKLLQLNLRQSITRLNKVIRGHRPKKWMQIYILDSDLHKTDLKNVFATQDHLPCIAKILYIDKRGKNISEICYSCGLMML